MTNNILLTDSNVFVSGSAQDNTQTDNVADSGTGDTIFGIGGNLDVTGAGNPVNTPPSDSNTTIFLGQSSTPDIAGVTDNFTLDGSANSLLSLASVDNSTVNFTVLGNGGGNTVGLSGSNSTVNVNIGVDPSATSPAGGNTVDVNNAGGTNTVNLGGPNNVVDLVGATNTVTTGGGLLGGVTLNGDATNNLTFTSGAATATIGFADDDLFGNSSTVTFTGTGNTLTGGDENFTVSGSTGSSTVSVGDGENTILMGGTGNTVTVWGGDNLISAGGSNAVVKILGLDGANAAAPTADPDDAPVPVSPTDYVDIAGTNDSVSATYENVNIDGIFVTSAATISLGDGNNVIVLRGTGGNKVTVGNGANAINATGNSSIYNLGDGANGVTLSGNNNTINVTAPTGVGLDIVQLGAGAGDIVNLDHAGGSVTDYGTGMTTVTQSGFRAVTVNLHNGIGAITLGNGNDTVTANGAGTTVSAGNGHDTVTANGAGDIITLGNGSDTVTANGATDKITLGNGSDTVTANGPTDKIALGNGANHVIANGPNDIFKFGNGANTVTANGNGDTGTFGTPGAGGSNTLIAMGSGDTWTFNENASSTVTATLGSGTPTDNNTLTQTGGSLNATLLGGGDTVTLNNVNTLGTKIVANGNNETFDFSNNSGGDLVLNPASTGDSLTFNGASNNFTGTVVVAGLNTGDKVDLEDLYTTGGAHISSFGQMLSAMQFTPTGDTLMLQGGGELKFAAGTVFSPSKFMFS